MRRNKLRLYLHLVWTTHERLPLITGEIERDVYRYIAAICKNLHCPLIAIGGMPDHLHILIAMSNTITISDIAKNVKGSSSRFITEKLRPGEWFAWQGNYGAFTVCPRHKGTIKNYILKQKEHHAAGSLWPAAEETYEEGEPDKRT